MPNHVYHYIALGPELTKEQLTKLEEIVNTHRGLCGYYRPMPDELNNTTSPTNVVSETEYKRIMKENKKIDRTQPFFYEPKPITKKMQTNFIAKYGTDNWYDWAYENWGTKWGCYNSEIDGHTLTFTTAWSSMHDSLIEEFAIDFPNFLWHWEEEQGFGATTIYVDGVVSEKDSYDIVPFKNVGNYTDEEDIFWSVQYTNGRPESLSTEEVKAGYYTDYAFDSSNYLGKELPENIKNKLEELKSRL